MERTDSHRTVNLRCEHEAKIQLRLETLVVPLSAEVVSKGFVLQVFELNYCLKERQLT